MIPRKSRPTSTPCQTWPCACFAGHLPVLGEWYGLPLIEHAGSKQIGDAVFNEIFHPVARRLLAKCDGCLRIGGPSAGADDMVATTLKLGKTVWYSFAEIPAATPEKGS